MSAKPTARARAGNGKARTGRAPQASPRRAAAGAGNALAMFERLRAQHPEAHCELDHQGPFQLLVATVLSAQATDVGVNKVTPTLFARWPNAAALAAADPTEVERVIGSLGFFRQKTKSIVGLSKALVTLHGGQVPRTLAELVQLPGVGRKTANVVLGVAFGAPEGVVVDTHVLRLSQRLGWTRHDTPEEVELDLMRTFGKEHWDILSHTLIFHGRRVCSARKPACAACAVSELCPSAFAAEAVGRKPPRVRTDSAAGKGGNRRPSPGGKSKTKTKAKRRAAAAPPRATRAGARAPAKGRQKA